jgi:hypothetical protein
MITRAFLALALFTHVAYADGHRELSLGSTIRALRTDSANAVTEDSLGGIQAGYAHGLGIELLPRLELWATGTFGWGNATGRMFQTLDTEVSTHAFMVGGRARLAIRGYLSATARLDVGTARAAVALRDDMNHTAQDAGWGAITQGALGLELDLVRTSSKFSLGLRAELGYVAASPIELTATPESGSDGTLELDMVAASLGSLNLSGKVFAIGLSSHF